MSKKFSLKSKTTAQGLGTTLAVEQLREAVASAGIETRGQELGTAVLSMESINGMAAERLDDAANVLADSIDTLRVSMEEFGGQYTEAQKKAGVIAGMVAGNVRAYLSHPVVKPMAEGPNESVVSMEQLSISGENYFDKRTPAFEAFDESENRNAVVYSIVYNMEASRQNEFGETLFPTTVVSPNDVGYDISVRVFNVYDGDLKRGINGAVNDFGMRNIIRGYQDSTLLSNNSTQIVPVFRPETAAHFVAPSDVGARDVLVGRETVTTAPLKVGASFSLLGISSTAAVIANGQQDVTDAIAPAAGLKTIYVKAGSGATADVLSFNVEGLYTSNFTASVQDRHRAMTLAFKTSALMLNKNTRRVDGSALQTLDDIVTGDLIVYLDVHMGGSMDLQFATTEVFFNKLAVKAVKDATGTNLSLTSGAGKDVVDAFAGATVIGYDLTAWRTNSNLRQRGDLLDTEYWNQRYQVPLLSPISCARPVNSDAQTDTSDLQGLVTTTKIRTSNAAVTTLLGTADTLKQFVDNRDTSGEPPRILGVGRYLVRPTYVEETLSMPASVDSRTSAERAKDVQATIINKLRDMVIGMYVQSGFKSAADSYLGTNAATPTVILAGDQELTRYLQVDGELRTIGPDFEVKIVSTQDNRMKGRLFVAFGYFDTNTASGPNALHFGSMLWKPELTLVVPVSKGGSTVKQLTVMPSFLHTVNCPVLGSLTVTGLRDVVATKVAANVEIV